MSVRGPRLEFAVGAFLLLALASLLVLALASTNGKFGFGAHSYPLKARFTNLGQLRTSAPVKIGGVVVGNVADIQLDPAKFDAVVTLDIDDRYKDLPADTSAGILTGGLLGESYVGLQPGGDAGVPEARRRDRIHHAGRRPDPDGRQVHVRWRRQTRGRRPATTTGATPPPTEPTP